MSNSFKLHPNIFPRGAESFPAPPIYRNAHMGANCAPVPAPSSPDKAISAIHSKEVLCTKERDDIRPQTKNVTAPVVFGLYCPSSQNLIKIFCMKSR